MKHHAWAGMFSAMLATSIVGSSIAASAVLVHYPALGGQAVRYGIATGGLVLVMRAWPQGRPPRGLREWGLLLALAATGLAGFNLCVLAAEQFGTPAAVGAFVGAVPLVLAVGGPLLRRTLPRRGVVIAGGIVTSGAVMAQWAGVSNEWGIVFGLGALGGEAAFSLLAISLVPQLGAPRVSAYACGIATILLAVMAVCHDGRHALRLPTPDEALALGYLAVIVTVVAFVAWYRALTRLGPEIAGLFAGIIPMSTLVCGLIIGTSAWSWGAGIGAVLVGGGVVLGIAQSRPPE